MTQVHAELNHSAVAQEQPRSVRGALTFIVPQAEKPAFHSAALTGGDPKVLFEVEELPVEIADMRPVAQDFSVEREGFELKRVATTVDDLNDDAAVKEAYYPEIESLLKDGSAQARLSSLTRHGGRMTVRVPTIPMAAAGQHGACTWTTQPRAGPRE